eukprot:gene3934-4899_t
MRVVVKHICDELNTMMDNPMAFFGHSCGAIVAFEVAKKFEQRRGAKPFLLIESGHTAPHISDAAKYGCMHKLPDSGLMDQLRTWGALPGEVLESEEMMALVLPSLRADLELTETLPHRPDPIPLDIPIHALTGDCDELVTPDEVIEQVGAVVSTRLAALQGVALQQMREWNKMNEKPNPMEGALCHTMCLEDPVRRWPDRLALTYKDERYTFRQLNDKASALARYLRSERNLQPDDIVGIYMGRCTQFVVSFFGILKAGGAYMPLDLKSDAAVTAKQVQEAGCVCVLTNKHTRGIGERVPGGVVKEVDIDEMWDVIAAVSTWQPPVLTPHNLKFCGCSSGTTGTPKAMVEPHQTAVASFYWRQQRFPLQPGDSVASNIFFTWELPHPLYAGCPLHIIDDDTIYDPQALLEFVASTGTTRMLLTPSLCQNVLDSVSPAEAREGLKGLKDILLCGEVVTWELVHRLEGLMPGAGVFSEYSIAECGTVSMGRVQKPPEGHKRPACPVGHPDPNVDCWVLDETMKPVPLGHVGELYVGGAGLAPSAKYLNKPELTVERYPPHPFPQFARSERVFRTGDGARFLPDGQLELLGRVAFMVKLRGYSIVPMAVENAMKEHPGIEAALVTVIGKAGEMQTLVGYYIPAPTQLMDCPVAEGEDLSMNTSALRHFLSSRVASFEVPSVFMALSEFPIGLTGKTDLKRLPVPPSPDASTEKTKSGAGRDLLTQVQKVVTGAWEDVLKQSDLHNMLDASFFDVGGTSLLLPRICRAVGETLGVHVRPTDMFRHNSIRMLAARAEELLEAKSVKTSPEVAVVAAPLTTPELTRCPLGVMGTSCRFPGGVADSQTFFQRMLDGVEAVKFSSRDELHAAGVAEELTGMAEYVPASALLQDVHMFDTGVFQMSKLEACVTDPQHRQLLQGAWEAAEQSGFLGCAPARGVSYYSGVAKPTYYASSLRGVVGDAWAHERDLMLEIATDKDYAAHKVSYHLDLRGPSVCVQTSCSTALTCVAMACMDLLAGNSDMAMAGAASILFPQAVGYLRLEADATGQGMPNSIDGHCRTFDAAASGTMFGDATGTVFLEAARQEGPSRAATPLAYIKGYGINNDGRQKESFNAPSIPGQQAAIQRAIQHAGEAPTSVTYVECHGTATLMGDPIEVAALSLAFTGGGKRDADRGPWCTLGALKPNYGHSNYAAGMGAVIKVAAAACAQRLPGQINFTQLNPHIALEGSPFTIRREAAQWNGAGPQGRRLAGMTCLGMGGTNVHMLVEQVAVEEAASECVSASESLNSVKAGGAAPPPLAQLVVVSARTRKALLEQCAQLRRRVAEIAQGRQGAMCPAGTKLPSVADVALTLQRGRRQFNKHRLATVCTTAAELEAALGDPAGLCGLRAEADHQAQSVAAGASTGGEEVAGLMRAANALAKVQPVFRRAFEECGAVTQQLTGEALCRPGTPATSLIFAVQHGCVSLLVAGGMHPAAIAAQGIGELVAAVHARVLSLETALQVLAEPCNALQHLQRANLSAPAVAIYSAHAGCLLSDVNARDPLLWAECLRADSPSKFNPALTLAEAGVRVLVECGGSGALLDLVWDQLAGEASPNREWGLRDFTLCNLLPTRGGEGTASDPVTAHLAAIRHVWLAGVSVEWEALGMPQSELGVEDRRVPLPTYPFEAAECGPAQLAAVMEKPAEKPAAAVGGARLESAGEWLSVPTMVRATAPRGAGLKAQREAPRVVLVLGRSTLCGGGGGQVESAVLQELHCRGHRVVLATLGAERCSGGDAHSGFVLRAGAELQGDLEWLVERLAEADLLPEQLLHLLSLPTGAADCESAAAEWASLVALTKAVAAPAWTEHFSRRGLDVRVVTQRLLSVSGEAADPLKAVLLGPVIVIPQEYPFINTQIIDVDEGGHPGASTSLAAALGVELSQLPHGADKLLALRSAGAGLRSRRRGQVQRWRLDYAQLPPIAGAPPEMPFQPAGVYLITGGLGRIGLSLAKSILEAAAGSIVVLSTRGAVPKCEEWAKAVADGGLASRLAGALPLLQEFGKRFRVVGSAKVHTASGAQALIEDVRGQHGHLDGVLHLAGLADLRYIPEASRELLQQEMEPKVEGTLALEEALQGALEVKFVVVFSSMAAILGGYGMVAYTAANCFMDSFVAERAADRAESGGSGPHWLSCNWDDWQFEYGKEQTAAYALTGTDAFAITPEEGFQALVLALESGLPQVLVSPRALPPRLLQWLYIRNDMSVTKDVACPIPTSTTEEDAQAALHQTLLSVYSKILADDTLKGSDNFFEMGADSLTAAEVLMQLKRALPAFGGDFNIRVIFEHPTVDDLATYLNSKVRDS